MSNVRPHMQSPEMSNDGKPFKAQFQPLIRAQAAELSIAFAWLMSLALYFQFGAPHLYVAGLVCILLLLASLLADRWIQRQKREFKCPRCGNLFFDRRLFGWNNGARSPRWHRCQICELQKWPP